MKRPFVVFFILLLLVVAYFFISGNGISYDDPAGLTEISPFSKDYSRLTKLYFIQNDKLISEIRTVNVEMLETEFAAVKALKKGPKISTQSSPIKGDVNILSVITTDRTCYVNLTSGFLSDSDNRIHLNVMAIVNTLAEFESIDFVQVLVEGKKISVDDGKVSAPLTKNTSLVQEKELQHKDIARKFLIYIAQKRYDLAFDLIDSESKSYATFREFKETAVLIGNDIKGYTQSYVFAKREQGRYIVQVKYVLRDSPNNNELLADPNTPTEIVFSWPMIQEDNLWKIKYFGY